MDRTRLLLLLLVVPHALVGPAVYSAQPLWQWLFGGFSLVVVSAIQTTLGTLLMVAQGATVAGGVARFRGTEKLVGLSGTVLAVCWVGWAVFGVVMFSQQSSGPVGPALPWLYGSSLAYQGVPAALALAAALTANRIRAGALAALAAPVLAIVGTQAKLTATDVLWGVPWVWNADTIAFFAYQVTAIPAALGMGIAAVLGARSQADPAA